MIDVNKLNSNIEEIEKQVKKFQSASRLFDEMRKLSLEVKADKERHDELIEKFNITSKRLAETANSLIKIINNLNQISSDVKISIDKNLSEIKKENAEVNLHLVDSYKNYETDVNLKLAEYATDLIAQQTNFITNVNLKYDALNSNYLEKIAKLEDNIDKSNERISGEMAQQLAAMQNTISTENTNAYYGIQNSIMSFITAKNEGFEIKFENKLKEDQANVQSLKTLLGLSILTSVIAIAIHFIK